MDRWLLDRPRGHQGDVAMTLQGRDTAPKLRARTALRHTLSNFAESGHFSGSDFSLAQLAAIVISGSQLRNKIGLRS